jgi:hypothetical protein
MPRKPDPRAKGVRTVKPHIRPNGRKLRSKENADLICSMVENGQTLAEIAGELNVIPAAITAWVRDDASNGGAEIATQYARAMEFRAEMMAEGLLAIADDKGFMQHPEIASALVNQQRLAVDARKWLLSKMLPRKYGDKIEISGDPSAPIVSRIELVAVAPRQLEPPTIEGKTESDDG